MQSLFGKKSFLFNSIDVKSAMVSTQRILVNIVLKFKGFVAKYFIFNDIFEFQDIFISIF